MLATLAGLSLAATNCHPERSEGSQPICGPAQEFTDGIMPIRNFDQGSKEG